MDTALLESNMVQDSSEIIKIPFLFWLSHPTFRNIS